MKNVLTSLMNIKITINIFGDDMPTTREEHVKYTREELLKYDYYIKIIEILKNENIKSYLDIGANVGELCNFLFDQLPTLSYAILIEPEPDNFSFMKNHVINKNITYHNLAISYGFKNGMIISNGNVGGFIVVENTSDKLIGFDTKTLEELNLPIVDLVKVDVEGSEYSIIENSSYLQKVRLLEIEFHATLSELKNNHSVNFVKTYLPNHEIIAYDNNDKNPYGRILLKLKL